MIFIAKTAGAASVAYTGGSFDFIDDLLNGGYVTGNAGTDESGNIDTIKSSSSPAVNGARNDDNGQIFSQSYDVFDWNTGGLGTDGRNDVEVIITTAGLGTVQNSSDYRSYAYANGTGLGSKIGSLSNGITTNPTPDGAGVIGTTGTTFTGLAAMSQTIEIRFLQGVELTISDLTAFSISSANTLFSKNSDGTSGSIVWEYSSLQLLDSGYTPFTSAAAYSYQENRASTGYTGPGTYIANGDTLGELYDNPSDDPDQGLESYFVGNNDVNPDDANGGQEVDAPIITGADTNNSSIASDQLYGIRFTHNIVDTRGVNNGQFNYTATINELQFSGLQIVPEPTSSALLALGGLALVGRRSRK